MADEPSRWEWSVHSEFDIPHSLFAIPTSVPHPSLRDGRGTRNSPRYPTRTLQTTEVLPLVLALLTVPAPQQAPLR